MIDLIFYYGTEIVLVRILNGNVQFASSESRNRMSTIDGLRISKEGAIKEFPDLITREDWKEEAIKRFKDKISQMSSEEEICDYIINDLKKYGYTPKFKQKEGFRREAIK